MADQRASRICTKGAVEAAFSLADVERERDAVTKFAPRSVRGED